MRFPFGLAILAALFSAETPSSAQPANDLFSNASVIAALPAQVRGDNIGASREPSEPFHGGVTNGTRSVWWRWTCQASGPVTFDCAGTSFDSILAIYSGASLTNLVATAFNDDAPGATDFTSSATFRAEAGLTYWIAVDSYSAAEGSIVLNATAVANDLFASSHPLGSAAFEEAITDNTGSGLEDSEPVHANVESAGSLWWSWKAPASGRWAVSTVQSDFNTVTAVYLGDALGSLMTVAANDDAARFGNAVRKQSYASFSAVAGETYRIAVAGRRGQSGLVHLELAPKPVNDDFATATPLTGSLAQISTDSRGASKESGEPEHILNADGSASLWWVWKPGNARLYSISTAGSAVTTGIAVYEGASSFDGLVLVARARSAGAAGAALAMATEADKTYAIAVDGMARSDRGPIALGIAPVTDTNGPALNTSIQLIQPRIAKTVRRSAGKGFTVRGKAAVFDGNRIVGVQLALAPKGAALEFQDSPELRIRKKGRLAVFRSPNQGRDLEGALRLEVRVLVDDGQSIRLSPMTGYDLQLIRP